MGRDDSDHGGQVLQKGWRLQSQESRQKLTLQTAVLPPTHTCPCLLHTRTHGVRVSRYSLSHLQSQESRRDVTRHTVARIDAAKQGREAGFS